MRNSKTAIFITGASTFGKSTLAKHLVESDRANYSFIPQTACRAARYDDLAGQIKCIDSESFAQTSFETVHYPYGLASGDWKNFLDSPKLVGVNVIGIHELLNWGFPKEMDGVKSVFILVRFGNSLEEDIKAAKERIKRKFGDGPASHARLTDSIELIHHFFGNEEFIASNFDIVVSQKMSVDTSAQLVKGKLPQVNLPFISNGGGISQRSALELNG